MRTLQSEKVKVGGEVPSPRFGHTFTMVSNSKAVLFGGAVSLANRFVITNESFVFDFVGSRWSRVSHSKHQFVPSERAAHAAVMVAELQMIVYGGAASGNQGLLKDELYILDLRKDPVWKIIEVAPKSPTPGQRYGHTMLFNKPHLIVFGGNSGNRPENDVWLLNILKGPFTWQKCEFPNKVAPCPRVYHSAAICEEGSAFGMMVVFGGRKEGKKDQGSQKQLAVAALNDIWGLRKHRDGSWDWVTPPKSETYSPVCRYQHLVCFVGSVMVIVGGRSNNPDDPVSVVEAYDTEKSEWTRLNGVSRYRHAIALYNKTQLFVHGGFEPELATQPLDSMVSVNLGSLLAPRANNWLEPRDTPTLQVEPPKEEGPRQRKVLSQNDNIQNVMPVGPGQKGGKREGPLLRENQGGRNSRVKSGVSGFNKTAKERDLTPSRIINCVKEIRLSRQAVVATGDGGNAMQIQRVPLHSLLEESKKLTTTQEDMQMGDGSALELAEGVLQVLLGSSPKGSSALFPFKKDKVMRLTQQAMRLVRGEQSLVGLRPPVKVFGSIYGRFFDLLRLFENFGFPDEREMESNEYLFLGNYVDKGFNSLETVCLLMALKIKFPEHVTLLRGKHEDAAVNRLCGLGEECALRLGENIQDLSSVFNQVNNFFECLPLAAAVEDKFLCLHGGLGQLDNLTQIKEVQRPLKVRNSQVVMDLLWSGSPQQPRLNYQSHTCTEQEVESFLDSNCLEMLLNTRDSLPEGVGEDQRTISISSVAESASSSGKAGILRIGKDLSLVPYLLNSSPTKRGGWVGQAASKGGLSLTPAQAEIRLSLLQA